MSTWQTSNSKMPPGLVSSANISTQLLNVGSRRQDEKRPRLDTGARNQSSHSAGSREDSSVDPKATKVPPGRRRADSLGSLATYSSASSHPSPVVTAVVEPQPTLFQVPTYLRPLSSTSNSPPSILSRRDMTMPYHQGPPKLQSAVDSVQELSVRATAMESREPHCSSAHLAGFPYDSDPSGNRESNSPSTMAQRVNQESSRSSNSSPSPTHSGYPAASSSQTSSTTDNRSQRTLPPLAAIKPGDKRVPFAPDLSSSAAPPAPYLRLSFSSTNSPSMSSLFFRFSIQNPLLRIQHKNWFRPFLMIQIPVHLKTFYVSLQN